LIAPAPEASFHTRLRFYEGRTPLATGALGRVSSRLARASALRTGLTLAPARLAVAP
jgi:hypothetical protein